MNKTELRDVRREIRQMTALLAWRLDAFATDARDERLLSSPVLDAFRGTTR